VDTILVAGAGVFGLTAAIELRRRGHAVRLLDPGPLPHPLAASTDISKVVRLEYGADADYTALGEQSIEGWRRWNRDLGPLYHEVGLLFLRRSPLAPGTLEQESFDLLTRRGHRPELLDAAAIRRRFPAWSAQWTHGTFNAVGGFAESGNVIARLAGEAVRLGVEVIQARFGRALDAGIETADGAKLEADQVVLALGAWTPHALPHLASEFRSTGHPVFHLKPRDPAPFRPEVFPVFCADISNTGWYGFPLHAGVIKIARHGAGRELHPESPERAVTAEEAAAMRAFVEETFPQLAGAEIAATRVCLYCDSKDGHFRIARDPERPRVLIAAGDSGHGFKFAPVLGGIIADFTEGRGHPLQAKFAWRLHAGPWQEAARAAPPASRPTGRG
jgi:glycine/D-amino acid oxidase-like deaminating enzyme